MARMLGPSCKLQRREGVDLFLKSGMRDINSKCKLTTPPGQHGGKSARLSNYGVQLRMKQRIRRMYGILERQFRNYYQLASKQKGSTGSNLLRLLESRLDNVVYRMGFASTRAEARQLVGHKGVMINGKTVNIPSCRVKPNDIITITEKAKAQGRIGAALQLAQQRASCAWLDVDTNQMRGVFKAFPDRSDLPTDINENLVVELYSK